MTRGSAPARTRSMAWLLGGRWSGLAVLVLALVPPAAAQQKQVPLATQVAGLVNDGLDLERDERYPEAAEIYRSALRLDPVNLSAMMGLERALKGAKQPREILPPLTRALARDPRNPVLRAIELRTWVATGPGDSVSAAAQRWIALAPESAEPYRAWTQALIQDGKLDDAQRVLA